MEAGAQERHLEITPSSPPVVGSWVSVLPSLSDLAFLLPMFVLFWCTTGVGWLLTDSDTGWHIRAGEWMLENRRVPAADLFSFTKEGQPWIAWEWLSDIGMAGIHRHSGLAGIVFVSLLVLALTSVCLYRSTLEESGNRLVAIILTGLAMAASTVHWLARPHLVTPLFAAIFCWVLNRVERDRQSALLWVLPPLTMLWVNLHPGFFVGIILLLSYALGACSEELARRTGYCFWVWTRNYLRAAGVCLVASLANPYGYHLHVHIARYLGTSFYLEHISEFQSIDFHSFNAAYFETLLVLAIPAAVWYFGARKMIQGLLLLSWSHLALFSARNIPVFAVIVAPGIGLAVSQALASAQQRCSVEWVRKAATSLMEIEKGLQAVASHQGRRWHLLAGLVTLGLAALLALPGHLKALQAEFDRNRFPVDAANFLSVDSARKKMRLYASWQWGGYLIYRLWPSLDVFDDGRTDFYGPAFVDKGLRAWDALPDWADTLARYRVNAALLPVNSALATVMHESPAWKVIYQDSTAVLFLKRFKTEEICGNHSGRATDRKAARKASE